MCRYAPADYRGMIPLIILLVDSNTSDITVIRSYIRLDVENISWGRMCLEILVTLWSEVMRMIILYSGVHTISRNVNTMIHDYTAHMEEDYAFNAGVHATGQMNHTIMKTASKRQTRSVRKNENKNMRSTLEHIMGGFAGTICFMTSGHEHGH